MGFYRLRVAGLSLGIALLLGCKGNPGPGLKLQLAESAEQHACVKTDNSGFPLSAVLRGGTVRLSVLQKQEAGWQFQCDIKATLPDDHPSISLGATDRSQFAFFAELFDGSGKRVFTGAVQGKSSASADGSPGILPLFEVGKWSCPASAMAAPRAFHSATSLPGGEVLLFGGVELGIIAGRPESMGLTDTIEIYDPSRAVFQTVNVSGTPPRARAFHQVAVLSSTDATIKLVAFGGISAPRRREALIVGGAGSSTPLRLAPCGPETKPGGVEFLSLTYASGVWTLTSTSSSETDAAAFAGVGALPQGGLVTSAGAVGFSPLSQCSSSSYLDLLKPSASTIGKQAVAWFGPSGETRTAASFQVGFLAPSLTLLSKNTAMVLGGQWLSSTATPPPLTALFLTGLPDAPAAPTATGFVAPGVPRAFHTATRLGNALETAPAFPTDVLVTGGFEMTDTNTLQPGQPSSIASAIRLYTLQNTTSAPTEKAIAAWSSGSCGATEDHYRAATFEAATATASGNRVVVTGGSPSFGGGCNDCEDGDASLLCTTKQAGLFVAGANQLQKLPTMALGRLGHRQTLLLDGNILVTGGLIRKRDATTSAWSTQATNEAEVFNPRSTDVSNPDLDDPATQSFPASERNGRVGTDAQKPCSVL